MADLIGDVTGTNTEAFHDVVNLMREADHRVGNSLQLLSSLLQMQERTLEEGPARDALVGARRRVSCIAQLHRSLSSSAGADNVPLEDYLESLSNHLWGAFLEGRRIELLLNADPFTVSAKMACSIGLAINELVVNAIKHGFDDGDAKGVIEISCGRDKDGNIQIDVGNVSHESTETRDRPQTPAECQGFGAKIVSAVLRQHKGSMETVMQNGVTI